jgi:sugar lactone lactonase YvrE
MNPRGVTVGPDGTVYVAEAGTGGDEPDFPTAPVGSPAAGSSPGAEGSPVSSSPATTSEASSPASTALASLPAESASAEASGSPGPATTHGDTGRVTAISPSGEQTVLVDGLTSYVFGSEVVGPADVAVGDDGTIYVSIGGPGPQTALFEAAGNANSVVKVDASGTVTPLANIGQYERENNPDPNAVDSNVGGIAMGTDGLLYVADSGGNDLYSVDPATGDLNVVAVFDGLPTPDGSANPARGGAAEVDPVPTDVVADPNGGVYVGFLTGAILWGMPGSAKVVHVDPDGTVTDAATGLNMVTGVAVSGDTIYADQLSTSFTSTPPGPGEVAKATVGGTAESLLTGLMLPYGIALSPDGTSMYIAINATGPDAASGGALIQCPLEGGTPSASASPAASTEASLPAESASPEASASAEESAPASAETSAEPTESMTPASESPLESAAAS